MRIHVARVRLRDADGDGYENSIDTCPLTPNTVWNPRGPAEVGDSDMFSGVSYPDGIPDTCDPTPYEATAGPPANQPTDHDGDGFDFDQNIHDPASIPDVGQVSAGDVRSFDDRRTFLGVYAHDEWTPAAPVTIAGGGRWDRTSEKLHARARELATNELAARDDERTDGAWSGDISALVRLIRTEMHAVQAINPYLAWKSSFKPAAPNLTEAERADAVNYAPGDVLVFHQNAKGVTKGQRVVVGVGDDPPPLDQADKLVEAHAAPCCVSTT